MKENLKKKFKGAEIEILIAEIAILALPVIIGIMCLVNEQFNSTINELATSASISGTFVKYINLGETLESIFGLISYICSIFIIDNLRVIFKNISETGKPFDEKNLKNIKTIEILAWIIYLLIGNVFSFDTIIVIVVTALTYIFKYGNQLQKESDQTL